MQLKLRDRLLDDPEVWAAVIAARFARQIDLPAGNLWEPGMARHMAEQVKAGRDREQVELGTAFQLGLKVDGCEVVAT